VRLQLLCEIGDRPGGEAVGIRKHPLGQLQELQAAAAAVRHGCRKLVDGVVRTVFQIGGNNLDARSLTYALERDLAEGRVDVTRTGNRSLDGLGRTDVEVIRETPLLPG